MSRHLYLLSYDIACPKRLYQVHKQIMAFAVSGQKSFYECWLTDAERHTLIQRVVACIDVYEDRVHVFQLDPRQEVQYLGVAKKQNPQLFMVM